ncbi:DNA polymerase III subunit beta [Cysteiniphilum litorale]|uniref:DNA polymerase III subunit beta n=1 Tax=Cysteiniphilum litorale TaxID=2056700 RepID=UPI003F8807EF
MMLQFTLSRDALLKPLQGLVSIAEKKHTIPVLSSVLFIIEEGKLRLKASDLETEIVSYIELEEASHDASIAIPAKKLHDIIRNLPEGASVKITEEANDRVLVSCNRSKFTMSILKASSFPMMNEDTGRAMFKLSYAQLNSAIKRVKFAMANNDVRYFLNGMLWEVNNDRFRTVATDGHRMASSEVLIEDTFLDAVQIIVPSKAIKELERTLSAPEDAEIEVQIGKNYFRIILPDFQFTSKLIEGRFPDYTRVIPPNNTKLLVANRVELKQALLRTAILSNETYRGVRLELQDNALLLSANNPEHEEAQDQMAVKYSDQPMEIGFNVNYLLNIVDVLDSEHIDFYFDSPQMSLLIKDDDSRSTYVVSPIKL